MPKPSRLPRLISNITGVRISLEGSAPCRILCTAVVIDEQVEGGLSPLWQVTGYAGTVLMEVFRITLACHHFDFEITPHPMGYMSSILKFGDGTKLELTHQGRNAGLDMVEVDPEDIALQVERKSVEHCKRPSFVIPQTVWTENALTILAALRQGVEDEQPLTFREMMSPPE